MIRANIYSRAGKHLCTKRFKSKESLERFVKYVCPKIYPDEWNFHYGIEIIY